MYHILLKWINTQHSINHCCLSSLGVYSVVTMELSEKEDFTVLKLKQTGIPDNDFQRTEEGWKRHYFESIKHTFGFGARLF